MTQSSKVMSLDANLNVTAAAPLAQRFAEHLNTPIRLDAADVKHIDQSCLQILISAARHWHSNGVRFEIHEMSGPFLEGLDILGLKPSIFTNRVPA